MLNSILMFRARLFGEHPYVKRGLDALDRFCIEEGAIAGSNCRNTCGCSRASLLGHCVGVDRDPRLGASPSDPRVRRRRLAVTQQIFRYGDWAVFNRKGKPAGWAFEFYNDYYPDVDDTRR